MKKLINRFESPAEFAFLLLAFAIALYFFIGSFEFTGRAWIAPRFSSLATMICIAVLSAKRLSAKIGAPGAQRKENAMAEKDAGGRRARRNILVTSVFFVGYLAVTWLSGFLISSALMALLYPLCMGYRKIKSVALCFAANVFFVLAFQKLMGVSLSRGALLDLTAYFF